MRIVFLGPPGAGKGTQADWVCPEYAIPHISTGDMLRESIAKGEETGLKAKTFMDKGELVPDAVVIEIIAGRIKAADCAKGFALDGFPRTLAQAESLDLTLARMGKPLDVVLFVSAPDAVIIDRLSGRRICKNCGASFHVVSLPPKKDGICDKCGGALYQRTDDSPQTIRQRLEVYRQQTADLVEYYRRKKLLMEVRGDRPIDAVRAEVKAALGSMK